MNLPVDIVKNITKFIGYPKLPFALALQLKRDVSSYQYVAGDTFILSTESIQMIRKTQILIELVLRPLRETGFIMDIQDIQYPCIDVMGYDFFHVLERLRTEGLCDYKIRSNTYWSDLTIGGIKFFLNWTNI